MYNYTIMRISCWSVFLYMLIAGIFIGGLSGITLGIVENESVGIMGGAFLGLAFGLFSGALGLLYALIFNAIAPVTHGLLVQVEVPSQKEDTIQEDTDNEFEPH